MKYRLKKNTSAEEAFVRDMERHGPLERVERGESKLLEASEYPEPLKRFLARQRGMLHVHVSAATKKKLDRLSRTTGIEADALARRWIEQGIARAAS